MNDLQEYEIDKTLGIKGPEDVAKMGIAEYNKQCRGIVMRYSNEWEVEYINNVTKRTFVSNVKYIHICFFVLCQ